MRPGLARRLAAIAGTAAIIAMGAIGAACGSNNTSAPQQPAPRQTSIWSTITSNFESKTSYYERTTSFGFPLTTRG